MKIKLLLTLLLALSLHAKDLKPTVEEVLSTSPDVLEKLKGYNVTKEDITSVEAGYYPKLDLSLGFGYEHTVRDGGTTDGTWDYGVYQHSLTYTQNLFNGYKTTSQVKQQKFISVASAYKYIQAVNDAAFKTVDSYLEVMRNAELVENEKSNVAINEEIFKKVKKLYDSGLTTLSEVNKLEASLSLAKSNLLVQENNLLDVVYSFQRVLGRFMDPEEMSKPVLNIALPGSMEEAAQYAIQHNPSIIISDYNIKVAQAAYKEAQATNYPLIDIEISQSLTNNLSAIEGENNKFRAMAYLKYNFFNGYADESAKQKSVSSIHQQIQAKNIIRRDTIESLNLSWAANEKIGYQLEHLKAYKDFAYQTLNLYSKEYDLGRRSLLDLLSAQNDYIASKAQIINAEYNMLFAKYRILNAMGTLVSTILSDTDTIYAQVGLNGTVPKNEDTLPITFDRDNDLIVDEYDLCDNSLSTKMRNIYGCAELYGDTKRIERYSGFLFNENNATLTPKGDKMVHGLTMQLQPYGFENLKFDILGNAFNEDMSKESLEELSQKRAQTIKDILVQAGAKEDSIVIHANGDTAPLYSTESEVSSRLNNRADIIVRKLFK